MSRRTKSAKSATVQPEPPVTPVAPVPPADAPESPEANVADQTSQPAGVAEVETKSGEKRYRVSIETPFGPFSGEYLAPHRFCAVYSVQKGKYNITAAYWSYSRESAEKRARQLAGTGRFHDVFERELSPEEQAEEQARNERRARRANGTGTGRDGKVRPDCLFGDYDWNRNTGSRVVAVDTNALDRTYDGFTYERTEAGRWVTHCRTHDVQARYSDIRSFLTAKHRPQTWCADCAAVVASGVKPERPKVTRTATPRKRREYCSNCVCAGCLAIRQREADAAAREARDVVQVPVLLAGAEALAAASAGALVNGSH